MRNYADRNADAWYYNIAENPEYIPFSFAYNDKKYIGFSNKYFKLLDKESLKENSKETIIYTFLLEEEITVKVRLTHYFSHGVTEWTVEFENNSQHKSGVIEDTVVKMKFDGENPVLKGILGDHVNQYRPYVQDLSETPVSFVSESGRATHINFPYFNLEFGDGGAMLAIGWAGTWKADFEKVNDKIVYTAKSVINLKTYLKPGEKIRTALFVYAPYNIRDEYYATNFWRSWYIEHNLPKADLTGRDMEPFSTCCLAYDTGYTNSDGSISERHTTWRPSLEKMIAEDVKVDFRWVDAGWYVAPDGTGAVPFEKGHDWWDTVGTWELDPEKWPEGTFLESTEFARKNGMKTLMWFEPERVTDPENLEKNYGYNSKWAIDMNIRGYKDGPVISNNIGNPECYEWTVTRICKMLKENKVDMYREDNNCDPAKLWQHLDNLEGEKRNGITECKFIDAHYRMWDDIIECTKNLGGCGFVDSCASGGGRNDLESMRRGVPLLRSDADRTTTALRLSMTTSFNKWIPFCGANTREKTGEHNPKGDSDVYIWRASYLPALNVDSQFVYNSDENYFDIMRFGLKEWRKVSPYLLKEFYTLTPWHDQREKDGFTAYSFYDSQRKKGILLAFRQEECNESVLSVKLPFVNDTEECILMDEDTMKSIKCTGEEFQIMFDKPRMSKLYFYEVK